MEITPEIREMLNETRENLSGYKRRHFMAQVVESMLGSSPMKAEKELGKIRQIYFQNGGYLSAGWASPKFNENCKRALSALRT